MLHLRACTAIAVAAAIGTAGAAGADAETGADARFEAPPLSAVAAMPEARQALIYDERRGEYAVARVGDRLAGDYRVVEVENDRVVLRAGGDREVFVVLPVAGEREGREPARLEVRGEARAPEDRMAPLDPYGRARRLPRVKAPPQSRAGAGPRSGRRPEARPP